MACGKALAIDPCMNEPMRRRCLAGTMYRDDQTLHIPVSAVKIASGSKTRVYQGTEQARPCRSPQRRQQLYRCTAPSKPIALVAGNGVAGYKKWKQPATRCAGNKMAPRARFRCIPEALATPVGGCDLMVGRCCTVVSGAPSGAEGRIGSL
jgi:hypothetical protein